MARILLIDDEPALRGLLRRVLERDGHVVRTHESAERGLAAGELDETDLLITDIYMPGLDGIELIQAVRRKHPSLRILAISGVGTGGPADPLTDASLLGADATLAKPFTLDQLRDAVRELLAG